MEIGALNHAGTWKTSDTSVGDFLALRRDEVARIVAGVQAVGRFSDPVMAEAHELGYLRDHPVDVRSLLLWSAGVTWAPRGPRPSEDDLAYLEDPQVMRRMCRMGADLQLTCLLDGLVAAGVGAGVGLPEGRDEIASILRLACELVDGTGRNTPEGIPHVAGRSPARPPRSERGCAGVGQGGPPCVRRGTGTAADADVMPAGRLHGDGWEANPCSL